MLSEPVKQKPAVSSVEELVELVRDIQGVRSVTVIRDVLAGVILGEVDEVDHEQELAAGVTYVLLGVGKLATDYPRGINYLSD